MRMYIIGLLALSLILVWPAGAAEEGAVPSPAVEEEGAEICGPAVEVPSAEAQVMLPGVPGEPMPASVPGCEFCGIQQDFCYDQCVWVPNSGPCFDACDDAYDACIAQCTGS